MTSHGGGITTTKWRPPLIALDHIQSHFTFFSFLLLVLVLFDFPSFFIAASVSTISSTALCVVCFVFQQIGINIENCRLGDGV